MLNLPFSVCRHLLYEKLYSNIIELLHLHYILNYLLVYIFTCEKYSLGVPNLVLAPSLYGEISTLLTHSSGLKKYSHNFLFSLLYPPVYTYPTKMVGRWSRSTTVTELMESNTSSRNLGFPNIEGKPHYCCRNAGIRHH